MEGKLRSPHHTYRESRDENSGHRGTGGHPQKRIKRERQGRAKGRKSELPGQCRQGPATAHQRPPPTQETVQEQPDSETRKRDCADSKLRGGGRARPGQPEGQAQSQDVRPRALREHRPLPWERQCRTRSGDCKIRVQETSDRFHLTMEHSKQNRK